MTDLPSILGAYAIVLGGLIGYVASVVRRTNATRRLAAALASQRDRGGSNASGTTVLGEGRAEEGR